MTINELPDARRCLVNAYLLLVEVKNSEWIEEGSLFEKICDGLDDIWYELTEEEQVLANHEVMQMESITQMANN